MHKLLTSQFFFERSTEKLFWNNVLLVLIHPSVILSCYQAWVSQQVGDNCRVKINTNTYVIALPFMKKREEEITGKQGNRNFYQVRSISYLGTSISINRSLPKVPVEGFLWSIYKQGIYHTSHVNLELVIEVPRQVAQQGVTCYSSITYS